MIRSKVCTLLPLYINDDVRFFERALISVLNQSFPVDICIVCDGPVKPEHDDVINKYNNQNVYVIKKEKNEGLPSILNVGIEFCIKHGYKYIARMDSDDISEVDRMLCQYEFMEKNEFVDMCSSNALIIDSYDNVINETKYPENPSFTTMMSKCTIIHPSTFFRADFFEKFGVYDISLFKSQDLDLWLRALTLGAEIKCINKALIRFRYDSNLILRRKNEQVFNLEIKKAYISNAFQYRFLWKNYLILFLPSFIFRVFLRLKGK